MKMLTMAAQALPQVWETAEADKSAIHRLHAMGFLDALLKDMTTKKPIIWATDTYSEMGSGFGRMDRMEAQLVAIHGQALLDMRQKKRMERTRKHGEVFTPLSVCKRMCDHAYKVLRGKDWEKYINSTVLEITCGEAPFLVSRRDLSNGELVPLHDRVGILDRKIRVITEKVKDDQAWLEWVFRAYQATYGYEFQGDNLLLARINMLMTFEEYLWDRWKRSPSWEEYKRLLGIIAWNIWQMNGLTGTIPYGEVETQKQGDLLGCSQKSANEQPPCRIMDWQLGKSITFLSLSNGKAQ